MQAIQATFDAGREPTDIELETLAQTWSEHCSHKTLKGQIDYDGKPIDNCSRRRSSPRPRNYAGAGRGRLVRQRLRGQRRRHSLRRRVQRLLQGGNAQSSVGDRALRRREHRPGRRDPRSARHRAGRQADLQHRRVLLRSARHAGRCVAAGRVASEQVMKGVVAGVRDYGNRMGIPTVNGAVYFDERYLGNPLVFCGTVGLIPVESLSKAASMPGDLIVAVGGRTGRDGIHGATFSSVELTSESESMSRRRGADRQRHHREEGARRDSCRRAIAGFITRSPTAAPAVSARRSARWAKSSARSSIWTGRR